MKTGSIIVMLCLFASLVAGARDSRLRRITPLSDKSENPAVPVGRVVLVHGFLETGSAFRSMKKHLQGLGYECLVPRLRPCDARDGLEKLSQNLKQEIDTAFGPDQKFSVIAFSMGGLVSRHYLQELGGAGRCERFFTISSPHNGTQAAWCYPGEGARQMRPGSEFLERLSRSESKLGDMPVVSYRTPMDLIILPADSSVWERAENLEFPVLLHPLMLDARPVIQDIERRFAGR
jgi:triacylglycerol lipase